MKPIAVIFAAALVVAVSGAARADVASIHAEIRGGGAGGQGVDGELQDASFDDQVTGLTYGALVGLEVLFVDAWIEHAQYIDDGSDFLGTWTQFMAGLDLELDFGGVRGGRLEGGEQRGGYRTGYGEIGFAAGFGVGTLEQVDPPLDNAQVDDKGFVGQVQVGAGYRFTEMLSLGVSVPVRVGYMFKAGVPANIESNHYVTVHASALLNLRLKFQLK